MRKNLKIVFYLLLAGCFTQCKVFDNEVLVAGYVYVPSYSFTTSGDGSQGDSTTDYTDIWMYSKGDLEGAFALPALIPIQKNGVIEMGMDGGIMRTGQNDERVPYPLLGRFYQTINLQPGKIDTIRPTFSYAPSCEFLLIEDFDNPGLRFFKYRAEAGDSIIKFAGEGVRTPGKMSGKIDLSANTTDITKEFMITTIDLFDLRRGDRVYWEVDYKSDVSLRFGFFAVDVSGLITTVPMFYSNVTDGQWKRVYIDLSEEVSARTTGTRYRPFVQILRGPGSPKPNIMFDNIKLIRN